MLAAGCGSEDGDGDASVTEVTKAGYLKQANAACRRARAGIWGRVSEFLDERRGDKPHEALYAELTHLVLLPTVESEMEGVRALRPPPGEDERIDELLFIEESALTELVFMQRIPSIQFAKRRFIESGKQLRAYGLPACANGPERRPRDGDVL
ncbi:MAG TPA: hypothetical protein VFM94_01075 [Solirubrobacterales bacterium]|nr:hypothetical protein [Solirubrobacterales bacterium]